MYMPHKFILLLVLACLAASKSISEDKSVKEIVEVDEASSALLDNSELRNERGACQWSGVKWLKCSKKCGGGTHKGIRVQYGGSDCKGHQSYKKKCNKQPCKGKRDDDEEEDMKDDDYDEADDYNEDGYDEDDIEDRDAEDNAEDEIEEEDEASEEDKE